MYINIISINLTILQRIRVLQFILIIKLTFARLLLAFSVIYFSWDYIFFLIIQLKLMYISQKIESLGSMNHSFIL